ncbi:bifunctional oligoribonuclease/PAP phosphatase NrnA [Akkermansiaceae bacterium]|nr:bifunctional oligoribonuclease/PAP phosphatase NrnA [Akkermansiaceae bacterium]
MKSITLSQISDLIAENQSFALLSHVNPDGDAIGSLIAMGEILEALGKTVYYRNQDGVPEALEFLPHSEKVLSPKAEKQEVDVLVALDCAKEPRLGADALAEFQPKWMINIDHHKTNTQYGDFYYIDSSTASTTQIIFELAKSAGYEVPAAARDSIYVGISTDTDSFKARATSAKVHHIAAELIEMGLDVAKINELTYETTPFRKVQLLKEYLNTMVLSPCKKIADWHLTADTKTALGIKPGDNEDMVNYMTSIDTVLIACSFEEHSKDNIRISLRSKTSDIDVSAIASEFGGGGHAKAAGIILENVSISDARDQVLAAVSKQVAAL